MKTLFIVSLLCFTISVYGQFQFTVSTNLNELTLDTLYSPGSTTFDAVSFAGNYYTTEVGKPRIPVKNVQYVLPENAAISEINVIQVSSITINSSYYMYPAQQDVPMYIAPVFAEPDKDTYESSALTRVLLPK